MRVFNKNKLWVAVPFFAIVVAASSVIRSTAQVPDNTNAMQQLGTANPLTPGGAPPAVAVDVSDTVTNAQSQVLSTVSARQFLIDHLKAEVLNELCTMTTVCGVVPPNLNAAPSASPVVQLDGGTLGDPGLTSAACGAMAKGIIQNQPISWTTAYQRASAWVILQQLLYQQAQHDRHIVADAQVKEAAQRQLNAYLKDPNPRKPKIAQGETAEDVFTSARVLAAKKVGMSIAAEKRYLIERALGSNYTQKQASLLILNWFAASLPRHTVRVLGLPTFDLSQALPPGTM
jgi:hypothetical protein